jgi:beta-glucanase (GH16 family)
MMKRIFGLLLLILLSSCNTLYYNLKKNPHKFSTSVPIVTERTYNLIFRDEFDSRLIASSWKKAMYWSGPLFNQSVPSSGYYSPENFTFTDSTVRLWTRYSPKTFYNGLTRDSVRIDYSIGVLDLYPWISQGHDLVNEFYVECRARMPVGRKEWPAFWLTGYEQWPPEIDIFEFWRDSIGEFSTNFHFSDGRQHFQEHKKHYIPANRKNEFHTYGLKLYGDQMEFYFDGFMFRKVSKISPFLHKFTLVINNGVHDDPGNDTFLEVDWVRIYRLR